MNVLLLPLKAPMMSAGDSGFGELRHTGPVPSRSLVIGILSAALGYERGNGNIPELHQELNIHVLEAKKPRIQRDYHIIQATGNQEEDLLWQRRALKRVSPTVTERYYLEDGAFVAGIIGKNHLLERCEKALRDPVYVTYLGRRSCPPSVPLVGSLEDNRHPIDSMIEFAQQRFCLTEWDLRQPDGTVGVDLWWDGESPPRQEECQTEFKHVVSKWRRDFLIQLPRFFNERPVQVLRIFPSHAQPPNIHPNDDFFENTP